MTRIAILGATSQIARDLIPRLAEQHELALFARRPEAVSHWLAGQAQTIPAFIGDFSVFPGGRYDAIINFVGVGDPARTAAMGREILDATLHYDDMALDYLSRHPTTRYLFLSSGAVYGTVFTEPVTGASAAKLTLNDFKPAEYYSAAKMMAEVRHRLRPDLPIFDIRIFNYFSHTQDIHQRFFLTDIVRSIRDKTVLKTSPDYIVRDFLHREDMFQLFSCLLRAHEANSPVDCYSRATIDKPAILALMHKKFGLRYEVTGGKDIVVNSTGLKAHYYSLWRRAADFGYVPKWSSEEVIHSETAAILERSSPID